MTDADPEDDRSDAPSDESTLAEFDDRMDRLEAQNEQLATRNEQLRDELATLRDRIDGDGPDGSTPPPGDDPPVPAGEGEGEAEVVEGPSPVDDGGGDPGVSRRVTLGALAALGTLGLGASRAAADPVAGTDALQEGTTMEYGGSYSGSTSSGHGLQLETPEKAFIGKATDTSGFKFGVVGRSAAEKGRGIGGYADATSGANFGVLGRTASTEGGGVFGFTGPDTGNVKGVLGVTASPDGTGTLGFNNATSGSPAEGMRGETKSTGGIGVNGKATASSGATYGVKGSTSSSADDAAGVRGENFNGTNGAGVAGYNLSDPANEEGFGSHMAVYGEADQGGSGRSVSYGVIGRNTGNQGGARGILGRVNNEDGTAIVANNGGARGGVARGLRVVGYQDTTQVTLSAYKNSTQELTDLFGATVDFDAIKLNDWPDSVFDTSDGKFTTPTAGKYHVAAKVKLQETFSSGDTLRMRILAQNNTVADTKKSFAGGTSPHVHLSKTIDLDKDDTVFVNALQVSGGAATIDTGEENTYLTIDKLG